MASPNSEIPTEKSFPPQHPKHRFRGNVFALMTQNRRAGVDVSAETCIPDWAGEVMDGDMVVGALMELEQ